MILCEFTSLCHKPLIVNEFLGKIARGLRHLRKRLPWLAISRPEDRPELWQEVITTLRQDFSDLLRWFGIRR